MCIILGRLKTLRVVGDPATAVLDGVDVVPTVVNRDGAVETIDRKEPEPESGAS